MNKINMVLQAFVWVSGLAGGVKEQYKTFTTVDAEDAEETQDQNKGPVGV